METANMESGGQAPAQEIETRQAVGDGSENALTTRDWGMEHSKSSS